MKIKTKLFIYFAILLVLSFSTATATYYFLRSLPKSMNTLEGSQKHLDFASRLQIEIEKAVLPPHDFLIHRDIHEKKEFELLNKQIKAMFAQTAGMNFSSGERRILDRVGHLYAIIEKMSLHILRETPVTFATAQVSVDMIVEMDVFVEDSIRELDDLVSILYGGVIINLQDTRLQSFYIQVLTVVSLLLTTGFGFCICIISVRILTKPLNKVFSGVRSFTNNNLSHFIDIKSPYEFQQH